MRLLDEKNNCRDHFVQKSKSSTSTLYTYWPGGHTASRRADQLQEKTFEVVKTGSDSVAVLFLCTLAHLSVSFSVRET